MNPNQAKNLGNTSQIIRQSLSMAYLCYSLKLFMTWLTAITIAEFTVTFTKFILVLRFCQFLRVRYQKYSRSEYT